VKKIKKKKGGRSGALPAFVVGFTHADPPPPGFLAAWFNQAYGGPLQIEFTIQASQSEFVAGHTKWRAQVSTSLPTETSEWWRDRLQWGHSQIATVHPLQNVGQDKQDVTLHVARLARGLTLLTEGTAYDVGTASYYNPSDWRDRGLEQFHVEDHVQVEQRDQPQRGQVWFYTRGLGKFGLEELETYRPTGLPDRPVIDTLVDIGEVLIAGGKVAKVGDHLTLPRTGQVIKVVRHRTDSSSDAHLHLREVTWV